MPVLAQPQPPDSIGTRAYWAGGGASSTIVPRIGVTVAGVRRIAVVRIAVVQIGIIGAVPGSSVAGNIATEHQNVPGVDGLLAGGLLVAVGGGEYV